MNERFARSTVISVEMLLHPTYVIDVFRSVKDCYAGRGLDDSSTSVLRVPTKRYEVYKEVQ